MGIALLADYPEIDKARLTRKGELSRLTQLLASQELALRNAFERAVREIKGVIKIKEIADFVANGSIVAALDRMEEIAPGLFTKHFVAERTKLFQQAGIAQAKELATKTPLIQARFDVVNQFAVDTARQSELHLIQNFTDAQRQSTKQALLRGITLGRNPREIARNFRDSVGLTPYQENAVARYRSALINNEPIALRRKLRDRRFDGSVLRAIRDGTALSEERINRLTERYRQRYIKYRAEVIARTEALRTANEGAHEMWEQAVESGQVDASRVRRYWITANDARVRNAHVVIPSLNPQGRGIAEHFRTPLGPLLMPGDPSGLPGNIINCRCVVVTEILSDREARQLQTGQIEVTSDTVRAVSTRREAKDIVVTQIKELNDPVTLASGEVARFLPKVEGRVAGFYLGQGIGIQRITRRNLINRIRSEGLSLAAIVAIGAGGLLTQEEEEELLRQGRAGT